MKVSNWLLSHCCPSAPESSGCSPTADSKGFEYVCASLSSLGFLSLSMQKIAAVTRGKPARNTNCMSASETLAGR